MEPIYADITLWNSFEVDLTRTGRMEKDAVRKIEVSALVDSGAYMLTVDESIKTQLGLSVKDLREVELAMIHIVNVKLPALLNFVSKIAEPFAKRLCFPA